MRIIGQNNAHGSSLELTMTNFALTSCHHDPTTAITKPTKPIGTLSNKNRTMMYHIILHHPRSMSYWLIGEGLAASCPSQNEILLQHTMNLP